MKYVVHLLICILFSFLPSTPVLAQDTGEVDTYLSRLEQFGFSGAVFLVKNEEKLVERGYGLADFANGIPNTSETVFSIGSITKQFTAAAIYKLEMQGKLSVSDELDKFFDKVPESFAGITIHQLLTHTSGMAVYSGGDFQQQSRDEMIQEAYRRGLDFKPGTGFTYSNLGYSVLAAVVEIASGQPYEEYLREHLFLPAGMYYTGYNLPDWNENTIAHYYSNGQDNGVMLDNEGFPQWTILGNGGIHSTAMDMYRWHQALEGNDILSEDAKKRMYTVERNNYASGWDVTESDHGTLIQHDGGSTIGVAATFRRYVDEDVVVIMFANRDGENVLLNSGLINKVEKMIWGGTVIMPPETNPEKKNIARYEGRFNVTEDDYLIANTVADKLHVRVFGQKAINAILGKTNSITRKLSVVDSTTQRILDEFERREYKSFLGVASEMFKKIILDRIRSGENALGDFRGFTNMGTVKDYYTGFGEYMSIIRMNFEKGSRIFRFHWADGRVRGLGGSGFTEPLSFNLIPDTDGTWKGYHIGLELPVRFTLEHTADGSVKMILPGQIEAKFNESADYKNGMK